MLCRSCTVKQCHDLGDAQNEIEIECPECDGTGCDECDQSGVFHIDGCPNRYCASVVAATNLADLYEKGLPPVAGGALDQAVWFIDAVRVLEHEEARIKADAQRTR